MKNRKTSLFIIMVLILIVALAACSQKAEAPADDNMQKTEAPAAVAEETDVPATTSEPTESTVPEESVQPEEQENPPESTPVEEDDDDMTEERTFTLEELAEFDGQEGRPAYVAVDGIVYDLSDSRAWNNGKHNGFTAGKDLTDEIKNISPHGVKNLEGIPIVGKLAGD